MKSILIIVSFMLSLIISCKKSADIPLNNTNNTLLSRSSSIEEIEEVISDVNFINLYEVDLEILNLTDTIFIPYWDGSREEEMSASFVGIDSVDFVGVLEEFGYTRAEELVSLYKQKYLIIEEILQNEVFDSKSASEVSTLLMDSYGYYLDEVPPIMRSGTCAQYYQNAMDGCDRNFAISAAGAIASGIIVGFFSVGTAGVFTGSLAMALANEAHAACAKEACIAYHICMGIKYYSKEEIEELPYVEIRFSNENLEQ
jgi:hypothetical protein